MPKYKVEALALVSYETDDVSPEAAEASAHLIVATGGARVREIQSATAIELTLEVQAERANLRLILDGDAVRRTQGEEPMRRHMAGETTYSEESVLLMARTELFAPLQQTTRWKPILAHEVSHDRSCRTPPIARAWRHDGSLHPRAWRHTEYHHLSVIREAVRGIDAHDWLQWQRERATIDVKWHELRCPSCLASVTRLSALVSIPWGERTLTREYAL